MRILKDRRGISPVITTVIIVAVGITIAIAVALWMSGLIGRFTTYEEIKISTPYAEYDVRGRFNIYLSFKNTGSVATSIDDIRINGLSTKSASWGGTFTYQWQPQGGGTGGDDLPISAKVGETVDLVISFEDGITYPGGRLTHSVSLDIKLISSGGKEYPTSAVLP